jgi:hypothetical protein
MYKRLTSRPGQSSIWPQRGRWWPDKKGKDEDVVNIPPNEVAEEEVEESQPVIFRHRLWEQLPKHNGKGKESIHFHSEESAEEEMLNLWRMMMKRMMKRI